jgi:hypothetical protein
LRKARGLREVIRNESRHRYKHTSIGNSRNTRVRNKHKKRSKKVKGNGRPSYRGQGR